MWSCDPLLELQMSHDHSSVLFICEPVNLISNHHFQREGVAEMAAAPPTPQNPTLMADVSPVSFHCSCNWTEAAAWFCGSCQRSGEPQSPASAFTGTHWLKDVAVYQSWQNLLPSPGTSVLTARRKKTDNTAGISLVEPCRQDHQNKQLKKGMVILL